MMSASGMGWKLRARALFAATFLATVCARSGIAQKAVRLPAAATQAAGATPAPKDGRAIIQAAAAAELDADRNDHTAFMYKDHDVVDGKDTLFFVVETRKGNLKKKLEDHGKPLSAQERQDDDAHMLALVRDTRAQNKQQKDNKHDDDQGEQLLAILPTAFLWTVTGEEGDLVTLDFKPDPNFQAPNMEAKVFGSMEGQVVVARGDNRIRTMRGKMISDVKIMMGLLGGLQKGGTFEVQRREVLPHHWQVTELHVHIKGKVFFATIGSQEDETRWDFKPSPAKNLQDALEILNGVPAR